MSLAFGHNDLELNHIHNVKPLVALPYYTQIVKEYQFYYRSISYNTLRGPLDIKEYYPRTNIINNSWIEEKNTQLVLLAHTFYVDDLLHRLSNLTIKYKLKCTFNDETVERVLIEEVNLMPFSKDKNNIIDYRHNFIFENKKYYISDIQPNFKNVFRFTIEITRTQPSTSLGNESMLQVEIRHLEKMKPVNDVMLTTL